jgi:ABC-type glycerol-3-phosphate transport system permease component
MSTQTEPAIMRTLKVIRQRYLIWVPLTFILLWTATPLVWSFASSFKTRRDFARVPPPFFPEDPTLSGYIRVLSDSGFWVFARNSFVIASISTLVAVALSAITAYGFARYAFKWRHVLLLFILLPRLVPRISLIVPVYDIIRSLGILNTHLALIIVYTGSAIPLATWIMIGFIGAIPKELDEAAKVDGANSWQVFQRIVLPLTVPGLLTIGVLAFRDAWNEFPFALALTNSPEVRTLPYQLFLFRDSLGVADYGLIQAFTILSILPILLIYLRLEKHVVSGLTSGAVK